MTVLSVGYLKHIWRSEDLVVLAHVPETPHLANISFKRELRGTFIACPRANAERDIVIAFMSVRPSVRLSHSGTVSKWFNKHDPFTACSHILSKPGTVTELKAVTKFRHSHL